MARTFVNLNPYEAAQLNRRANTLSPLDALLQGAQQGLELQQLPGKLQDQALARQLNNALNQQKLYDLQNPEEAFARKLRQELQLKLGVASIDPNSGVTQSDINFPVATPGAITAQQTTELPSQELMDLRQAARDAGGADIPNIIPTAPRGRDIVPLQAGGKNLGYTFDANVPAQAPIDELNRKIQLLQSRPFAQQITKEGYRFNPGTGQLEQVVLPTDPNVGLEDQRRQQVLTDIQAKYDAAAQLATTKAELDRLKQARDQEFRDEQGDKRDITKLNLADKRSKDKSGSSVEGNQYIKEDLNNAISSVDTLISRIGPSTVGLGASMQFNAPNSPARDFASVLDQLKSQIRLGTLAKMKSLSKTGSSGLGAVSNQEGKVLEQVLGSMDQFVGQNQFKENMTKIRDSLKRWNEAIDKYGIPDESNSGGSTTGEKIVIIAPDGTAGNWPSNKPIPEGFKKQ